MTHPASRRLFRAEPLFLLCGMFWLIATTAGHASATVPLGEWVTTGSPVGNYRGEIPALLPLPDGTALLIGRPSPEAGPATAERYHPDTGTWTASGSLHALQAVGATATLLPSGLILVAGGLDASGAVSSIAELYDAATTTSQLTGVMSFARIGHQATLLPSGKVLVSGGTDASTQLVGPAELYDPLTGTWSLTGVLNDFRARHTAVLLSTGQVLVAGGGMNFSAFSPVASAIKV